jgi:hypothetical protein
MKRELSYICATLALESVIVPMAMAQNPSPSEVKEIAEHAYIYAYPLVVMKATGAAMPLDHLTHVAQFPDANFRLIVRPNADTLYSTAWLDVSKEPLLLHVPDSGGRFYLLQFMDAWTETFADPGSHHQAPLLPLHREMMRQAVSLSSGSVAGRREDGALSNEAHRRIVSVQVSEDGSEFLARVQFLRGCRILGIHIHHEMRVDRKEGHLAFGVTTVCAMRVRFNQFPDSKSIRGLLG